MTALRPAEQVMTLSRLGSLHQTRLSFMRQLTRRLAREGWQFSRPHFQIDAQGVGYAVYTLTGKTRSYSLVAFAHDLPPEQRSDRVIATAWDATFTLYDGCPSQADIARLAQNVPLQEAGRISESELSLSRANRSARLWDYCVEKLSQGQQPAQDELDKVGYLMRTTAVYGSAKFGAADRACIQQRPELHAPFQVEMLSVFLTRCFVRDLLNHMAVMRGGAKAVPLAAHLARRLGIGNSTGLGMAPYIINHPKLFHNWIYAKETALARVRAVKTASADEVALFQRLYAASIQSVQDWHSEHPVQQEKLVALRADLEKISAYLKQQQPLSAHPYPWDTLVNWSEQQLSLEGQELLASLVLEPYGALVDALAEHMADNDTEGHSIDGAMSLAAVRTLFEQHYAWALDIDWEQRENCARAWYVSEEKLEPRLGERFEEPIADYEQPLAPAKDAALAYRALVTWEQGLTCADFLLEHPEFRLAVKRAQLGAQASYAELYSNTISKQVMPIDMLRAKLSFFGATHFDPRSDRWVRIAMYKGAPYPDALDQQPSVWDWDFWVYQGLCA